MLAKIQIINALKAHIDELTQELEKTEKIECRVALLKEKGDSIRALKGYAD